MPRNEKYATIKIAHTYKTVLNLLEGFERKDTMSKKPANVRPVNERDDPNKLGWTFENGSLVNPKFGEFKHVAVINEKDEMLWDQVQIIEKPGVIVVPTFIDGNGNKYVGLIHANRVVAEIPDSLEFPRGFSKPDEDTQMTAIRETYEEMDLEVKKISKLGKLNANTAFYKSKITVYVVEVDPKKPLGRGQNETEISKKGIEWYKVDEFMDLVAESRIECGLTQAAFLQFMAFERSKNRVKCDEGKTTTETTYER